MNRRILTNHPNSIQKIKLFQILKKSVSKTVEPVLNRQNLINSRLVSIKSQEILTWLLGNMQLRAQMEKKLPNMFTPYRKTVEKHMEKLKSTGNTSAIAYQQEIEPVINSFPFDSKFLHKNPEICEKAGFQNIDQIAVTLQIAFDTPNTVKNFMEANFENPKKPKVSRF